MQSQSPRNSGPHAPRIPLKQWGAERGALRALVPARLCEGRVLGTLGDGRDFTAAVTSVPCDSNHTVRTPCEDRLSSASFHTRASRGTKYLGFSLAPRIFWRQRCRACSQLIPLLHLQTDHHTRVTTLLQRPLTQGISLGELMVLHLFLGDWL